jgi:hypothetical protein
VFGRLGNFIVRLTSRLPDLIVCAFLPHVVEIDHFAGGFGLDLITPKYAWMMQRTQQTT